MRKTKRICSSTIVFAAILCSGNVASAADHIEKYACARVSGGPMKPFVMTINFDAKEIDLPVGTGLPPDVDSVEMTETSIRWGAIRGFAVFTPKTGELDWDLTDDYDYLDSIDQPSDKPESDFKGVMQCNAVDAKTAGTNP